MPIIENLKTEFLKILPNVIRLKIAVSLAKNEAFKFIQENINKEASQSYIIGIDLPTDYAVFEQLFKSKDIASRVFLTKQVFHAKLYIFELENKSIAYISSANLTMGGFSNNIELTYKIEDKEEVEYLFKWYDNLFANNDEITEKFLADYRNKSDESNDLSTKLAGRKTSVGKLKKDHHKEALPVEIQSEADLLAINFTNQFFKGEHYLAFWGNKPYEDSSDKEREVVHNKLLELDSLIIPEFNNNGFTNLHRHPDEDFRTATYVLKQAESFGLRKINALWVHYGKSRTELDRYKPFATKEFPQSFINHIRVQCVVRKKNIEVALLIGKPNGSTFERRKFKEIIADDKMRKHFLELLLPLREDYWIGCNDEGKYIHEFSNESELIDFTRKDKTNKYFSIGIDFQPGDNKISIDNIKDTVINEIKKLYPLYELLKHRQ